MKQRRLAAALGLLLLAGCGASGKQNADPERFMVTEGVTLTQRMDELAGDQDYLKLITVSGGVLEIAGRMAAQDYARPKRAVLFEPSAGLIASAMGDRKIPPETLEKMNKRLNAAILASLINGTQGAELIAATSLVYDSESYIQPEGWQGNRFLYLEYEGEFSSIVSFTRTGDGVITGTASMVKNDGKDLPGILEPFLNTRELNGRELPAGRLTELLEEQSGSK